MKKIISGVLSAVILTSVLCACNDGGNQSNSSQSGNNADSSQQTVTTEVATTQPATEPNYKDTNYVAPIPPKNQTYKFEEISLDDAATSSGYSIDDSKFRIADASVSGDYLALKIIYSNINSTDFSAYNVIYDLNGNMVANTSNIAISEGYMKSATITGIYDDYIILEFNSSSHEWIFALYNLKTQELKYIPSEYSSPQLDNGVIIISKVGDEGQGVKHGALDLKLNEIIPAEYDELCLASPNLFRAKKGEKYGLVDFNNKTVTDFNYKMIVKFTGVEDDSFSAFVDFDKNINKYTVALDESDKVVLIDKEGKTHNNSFEISGDNLNSDRVVSQYNDKTYIEDGKTVMDADGNIITDDVFDWSCNHGFVNGYCVTKDNNNVFNLIDSNGNVIFSKSEDEYGIANFSSVDQNGLFDITYYLKSNHNEVKTEFIDLGGNVIQTVQENGIEPIGHGIFKQLKNKTHVIYRITVE